MRLWLIVIINESVDDLHTNNEGLGEGVANISNLIQKLSEISEQNAATAQELNATTDRVNDNVELLSENGGSVSRSAEDLESIIARFKVDNNPFISEGTNDTSLEETTE